MERDFDANPELAALVVDSVVLCSVVVVGASGRVPVSPTMAKPAVGTPRRARTSSQTSITAVAPMPMRTVCAMRGREGMGISRNRLTF